KVDVANDGLGGARRVMGADVEQAQDRFGAVPVLAEGSFGAGDRLARQLPVRVQPEGVADHANDAVLAVAAGQIARHLGAEVLGGHADIVLAALDLLLGGEAAIARGVGGGPLRPDASARAGAY